MTLELFRIDDRLIHGQVVVGWGQPLGLKFIVLVDDAVATSDWEQELYRMGVPPEMDVYFHDVGTAATRIAVYRADPRAGLLLTGDIGTMQRLAENVTPPLAAVNVGGIHSRPGRAQKLRYVFLSSDEATELRALQQRGVKVTAQDLPGARCVPLEDLLNGSDL